ncbi:MAG TPA: hypothetical protein VGZ23_00280 [bacterium]|nr:hypothetical protein [bacterium]
MHRIVAIAVVLVCALSAAAPAGAGAVSAQSAPMQFLPWPPPVPAPVPFVTAPPAPATGPLDPGALAASLHAALAALQNGVDRLAQWVELLRQAAAGTLTRIVVPLPTDSPAGAGPADIVAELAALPEQWRAIVAAALAKVGVPASSDGSSTRRAAEIADSPELSHEAGTIVAADQQVISGAVEHEVAIRASAAVAVAAVRDPALPAAADAAQATGDQLIGDARGLPSARAGIELLVAGMGAGLRHQAALSVALADRITGLLQQTAQLSGQMGALAGTIGVLTERNLERDRRALDARLGVADAARGGAALFRQLLAGAGEPGAEIRLDPLY